MYPLSPRDLDPNRDYLMAWSGSQQNLNGFLCLGAAPRVQNRVSFVVNHSCYREMRLRFWYFSRKRVHIIYRDFESLVLLLVVNTVDTVQIAVELSICIDDKYVVHTRHIFTYSRQINTRVQYASTCTYSNVF